MNHRSHDPELLSAHASGYEPDREAAEALIASCPECRRLFEQQVQMRSILTSAGSARLNAAEETALLAAITSSLPAVVSRLPAARSQPARAPLSPAWGRLLGAAAALVVVVGVGAILAGGGNGFGASATTSAAPLAREQALAGRADQEAPPAATTAAADTLYGMATANDLDALKAEAEALETATAAEDAGLDTRCAEETEQLAIVARGSSVYQDRPVLLFLTEDAQGGVLPRVFYADDCTEIPLP